MACNLILVFLRVFDDLIDFCRQIAAFQQEESGFATPMVFHPLPKFNGGGHGTGHGTIKFHGQLLGAMLYGGGILKSQRINYCLNHRDFLTDTVYQREFHIRKHDRQRNAGETTARADVDEVLTGNKLAGFGQGQGV